MKLNDLSDEELMTMYQSGAEDAFLILYGRHAEKIYGFLRARVWNAEKANELFQDVFLKVHRSKQLYNQSLPALPWIFSITKSVLNDGLRAEKKARRDSENGVDDQTLNDQHTMADVTDLLSRLPENQRRAIELRYINEQTFEEIAASLETTSENARKIVSRAFAKLRSFANEKGE